MADYYQLITKAVAGLDPAAPSESRRALYERAHAALLAEMRTISPPFTEAEITRERLALEEAVRRVEGNSETKARDVGYAAVQPREVRPASFSQYLPPILAEGAGMAAGLSGVWPCSILGLRDTI